MEKGQIAVAIAGYAHNFNDGEKIEFIKVSHHAKNTMDNWLTFRSLERDEEYTQDLIQGEFKEVYE